MITEMAEHNLDEEVVVCSLNGKFSRSPSFWYTGGPKLGLGQKSALCETGTGHQRRKLSLKGILILAILIYGINFRPNRLELKQLSMLRRNLCTKNSDQGKQR